MEGPAAVRRRKAPLSVQRVKGPDGVEYELGCVSGRPTSVKWTSRDCLPAGLSADPSGGGGSSVQQSARTRSGGDVDRRVCRASAAGRAPPSR